MSGTAFYGLRLFSRFGGRAVSAKGVSAGTDSATRFTTLTSQLLAQIPAFREHPDVRARIEVLPMQSAVGTIDGLLPTELLEASLQGLELDTRGGMVFVTQEIEDELGGYDKRPKTLGALIPFLEESVRTYGDNNVIDHWTYAVSGTRSIRAYLNVLFHYGGTKPLALHFDCFVERAGEAHRIRTTFPLGELIDENTERGFRKFLD